MICCAHMLSLSRLSGGEGVRLRLQIPLRLARATQRRHLVLEAGMEKGVLE